MITSESNGRLVDPDARTVEALALVDGRFVLLGVDRLLASLHVSSLLRVEPSK